MNEELQKAFDKIDKKLGEKISDFEYELLLQYKEALKRIRFKLSEMYRKYGDKVDFTEMAKYNRLESLEKQIAEEIKDITGITIKSVSSHLKKTFKNSATETINTVNGVLGLSLGSKFDDKVILEAIKNPFDRVKWQKRGIGHAEKAIEQIKGEIVQGLIQGKGYSQTAANISDKVNTFANNMTRIVRTESHRVQVKGRNEALNKSIKSAERLGIKLVKVWAAIVDGKVRDQHAEMNGKPVDDDGLFTLPDGTRAEAPGQTGVAEHDVNCRCSVVLRKGK